MSAQQSLKEELSGLYYDQSKHSVYQTLPRFVEEAFSFNFAIDQQWRGDQVRMDYLEQLLEWTGKSVIDIGANTGYFALNLAHDHDCRVTCIEANPSHCLLIERIAEHFQMQGVHVVNQAVGVGQAASLPKADVALLFNVLHHAGHDFDQEHVRNPAEVEEYCVQYLGALRQHVNNLVFQMGYNWGGDKSRPIVAVADTRGFFAYQSRILARAGWRIERAGMAFRDSVGIAYHDLELTALARQESLALSPDALDQLTRGLIVQDGMSEFYRRPILLCRSDETPAPRA